MVMSPNNSVNESPGLIFQISDGSFIFSTKSGNTVSVRSLSSDGVTNSVLYDSYLGSSSNFESYCKSQS